MNACRVLDCRLWKIPFNGFIVFQTRLSFVNAYYAPSMHTIFSLVIFSRFRPPFGRVFDELRFVRPIGFFFRNLSMINRLERVEKQQFCENSFSLALC